jgi:rhomboid family GlyGly-CTERM serine protease
MPQTLPTTPQGFSAALRRTRPDLWCFTGLVVLFNLHLLGIGSPAPLVFFPLETAEGQWWRLFTHPFAHLTFYHLALDAGAFFLLYAGLSETRIGRKLALVVIGGLSSLVAALVWAPGFGRLGLCGLSGIAHGLMAVSGLEMIFEERHRLVGWLSFGTVAAKSVYEAVNGRVLFEFMHMGLCGTPLAACHLGGVAGAATLFFLFRAADRLSRIVAAGVVSPQPL